MVPGRGNSMNRVIFKNWMEVTVSGVQRTGGGHDEAREVEKVAC